MMWVYVKSSDLNTHQTYPKLVVFQEGMILLKHQERFYCSTIYLLEPIVEVAKKKRRKPVSFFVIFEIQKNSLSIKN